MLIAERVWRLLRRLAVKRLARSISKVELTTCFREQTTPRELLQNLHSGDRPGFFFNPKLSGGKTGSSATATAPLNQTLKKVLPQSRGILKDADEICTHNFDLLGSEKRNVDRAPGKIDWHRDFKSGETWEPSIFYTDVRSVKKSTESDIKVPWELSRFQHLPTLGKAYWLTSDEKYTREFTSQLEDWIESNPPLYGVNWTTTMDVAIRVVNWIWGFYFFRQSPELNDQFLLKFLKSLYIHGKFIMGNLERTPWGITSNHYLSNLVGLLYLGLLFPEFKEARKWREHSIKELLREMKRQVYADGVDYEGSPSYHRLVTELFLSATLLGLKNGLTFPEWYLKRLERMLEFIARYTKPDGTAPQIGDNDDGRLHILANYGNWARLDHRYLLSTGAVLFNRPDLKHAAGEFHEEALWILGEDGASRFNELANQKTSAASRSFPSGGFYIMRNDNLHMMVDCAPADPKAPSGHKHNSRLSFELFAYNQTFIVDPGTYLYTADKAMRNLFRSTKYHNTIVVDEEEQSRLDENRLFSLGLDAAVRVNRWESTAEYDFLDAEHRGYQRLKEPVIHRRLIFCNKQENYWVIRDILTGRGLHHFDLYFHFAPVDIEIDSEHLVTKTKAKGANLAIIPLNTEGLSAEIEAGWVSYRYGIKVEAPIVRYQKEAEVPTELSFVLYPDKKAIDIDKILHQAKFPRIAEFLEAKES